jgi:hypothetical protein
MLFPFLLVGHLIGDWIVQTDWQAAHKTTSWKANQQHVLTYHLTLLVALMPFTHWTWGWGHFDLHLLAALAFSWVIHSFVDRRWPVKRLLHVTRSPAFAETPLGILAADQTIHIATLALMAAWLRR